MYFFLMMVTTLLFNNKIRSFKKLNNYNRIQIKSFKLYLGRKYKINDKVALLINRKNYISMCEKSLGG